MIPKIIHYCWLSHDPYPEQIQKCIDSWKKNLPDYKIMLWNYDRFPRGKSKWVDQAFDNHKYAFAADYIRLYALYNYGGIYLDSDVEVLKPFDDLLDLPYFIGQENTPSGIEAATIGCKRGWNLIKTMLSYYENREFKKLDGTFSTLPLPLIFRKCIESYYKYNPIKGKSDYKKRVDIINVFPIDWFSPKHWLTKEFNMTSNTYSIHHFAGSWVDKKNMTDQITIDNNKSTHTRGVESIFRTIISKLKVCFKHMALTNAYFAFIYFSLIRKERMFFANDFLFLFFSDYKKIAKIGKALVDCQFEFIKKEESMHADLVNDFYPIARIVGTDIEIHANIPDNRVFTKEEMRNILKVR